MSKLLLFTTLSLIVCLLGPGAPAQAFQPPPDLLDVKLFRCEESDTCSVKHQGRLITVTLTGINTPRIKGGCPREIELAKKARQALTNFLYASKRIDLVQVEHSVDPLRIRARMKTNVGDASSWLITMGHARYHFGGINSKRKSWCKKK